MRWDLNPRSIITVDLKSTPFDRSGTHTFYIKTISLNNINNLNINIF